MASIKEGDLVQMIKSRRTYFVKRIKPNGRLVLWRHGWPLIRNANPARVRVVERQEVPGGQAA